MKKLLLLFVLVAAPVLSLFAQVPHAMKYQTVVRNTAGEPIVDQEVNFRFTVLQGGNEVFQETQLLTTNDFGLINANIGEGTGGDDLGSIDWTGDDFDLQVELDIAGGNSFELLGSSSLLTMPFAFQSSQSDYALLAESVINDEVDDADADPSNELQILSLNGNQLSISNGNSVELPSSEGEVVADEERAKAWAHVDILGNCNVAFDAYNVLSTNKTTTGVYVVSLPPGLFSVATNPSVMTALHNDLAPGVAVATYSSTPSQITVRTYDMNGTPSDRGFNITIFGK